MITVRPSRNNNGLLDLIAALTAVGEGGRLEITGPGTRGAFFFKSGNLVEAQMGPFSGFAAVTVAVSMGEATFRFDASIQPPPPTTLIPLNERFLLKERFGIETNDLLEVEDQVAMTERADASTAVTEVEIAREATVSDARQFRRGKTRVRESSRTAARNPGADPEKNKRSIADRFRKRLRERPKIARGLSFATFIPERKNPGQKSSAPKRTIAEVDDRRESAAEQASRNQPFLPVIESSAVEIRGDGLTKRCPTCNRVYDDLRIYCRYDSSQLVNQIETNLDLETPVATAPVLFWACLIFTLLISALFGYWLNNYLFDERRIVAQNRTESQQPSNANDAQPLVEGALSGKEVTLVKPEYPDRAKSKGVTGDVTVAVLVKKDGVVISARALNGNSLLRAAAVAAARKSRFSQEKLVGQPPRIFGTITYKFKL